MASSLLTQYHRSSSGLWINPHITFQDASSVDSKIYKTAIAAINASISGWSLYDKIIFDHLDKHPTDCWLAFLHEKIVGYAVYKPERKTLSFIAVDHTYRSQRIGSSLMDKIITIARDKSILYWGYRVKKDGPEPFYTKILTDLIGVRAEKTPAGCYSDGTPCMGITLYFKDEH